MGKRYVWPPFWKHELVKFVAKLLNVPIDYLPIIIEDDENPEQ